MNRFLRGKTLIRDRLFFGGGYPMFRWKPKLIRWGSYVSLFWLGTELVFKRSVQ